MTAFIESEAELRKNIPKPPKMTDAKRLPALEEHAGRFVSLCGFAAFANAGLWDPTTYVDRKMLPTFGRMLIDQMEPNGRMKVLKSAGLEIVLKRDERKGLY